MSDTDYNEYNVKLDRCAYYERERFGDETKKKVLKKTDNKCAICGMHLQLRDGEFTIDHYLPLNKGGSNNIKNLIPLCKDCNNKKSSDVIKNDNRIPYIKSKYKLELMEITKSFINEYIWLDSSNILRYDDEMLMMKIPFYKYVGNGIKTMYATQKVSLTKEKQVTDELINFITAYNEHYGYGVDYIRSTTEDLIRAGKMYAVRTMSGELVYAFYFFIRDIEDEEGSKMSYIEISNIITKVNTNKFTYSGELALYGIIFDDIYASIKALGMKTFDIGIQLDTKKGYEDELFGDITKILVGDTDTTIWHDMNEGVTDFKSYLLPLYVGKDKDFDQEEIDSIAKKDRELLRKRLCIKSNN